MYIQVCKTRQLQCSPSWNYGQMNLAFWLCLTVLLNRGEEFSYLYTAVMIFNCDNCSSCTFFSFFLVLKLQTWLIENCIGTLSQIEGIEKMVDVVDAWKNSLSIECRYVKTLLLLCWLINSSLFTILWDVKDPTPCLKRVGQGVCGVVLCSQA